MESEVTALVEGDEVRVLLGGTPVGVARFEGERLVAYRGAPLSDSPETHQARLDRLARELLAQGRAELAAMEAEAYDEDGVDVSLIRWSLGLSPLERLRELDRRRRDVALGRAALRASGIVVPNEDGLG